MTATELAKMALCSERTIRRLAPTIPGHRTTRGGHHEFQDEPALRWLKKFQIHRRYHPWLSRRELSRRKRERRKIKAKEKRLDSRQTAFYLRTGKIRTTEFIRRRRTGGRVIGINTIESWTFYAVAWIRKVTDKNPIRNWPNWKKEAIKQELSPIIEFYRQL